MPSLFSDLLLAENPPHLALKAPLGAGKSHQLRVAYRAWLEAGRRAENLLVWVPNFSQAAVWKSFIAEFPFAHGETQVFTFRSWVRNELTLNWPLVEQSGLLSGPPKSPEPFMVGISAAQQILRDLVEELMPLFPALERCYTMPIHRLIQILDTYARLVEHGLSPQEAAQRLDRGHELSPDSPELHRFIGAAIARYREFCFEHRVLDYNTQLELFHRALWNNKGYRERFLGRIEGLIVDNVEETLPVAQQVIEAVLDASPAKAIALAYDENGGLREYLGGDPEGASALVMRCEAVASAPETAPTPARTALADFGRALAQVALAGPEAPAPEPVPCRHVTLHPPRTLRVQMFEAVGKRLQALVNQGISQDEIVVIAPVVDPLLSWHLRQSLAAIGKPLRVLTGSNRVIDHRPVRILVTLARLARPQWNAPPVEADVAEMLEALLDLHALEGPHLQQLVYPEKGALTRPEAEAWPKHLQGRRDAYEGVYEWVMRLTETHHPLDRLFEDAFANLYAPRRLRSLAPDEDVAGQPVAQPYAWGADEALEILQIEQLIQGARSYRKLAAAIKLPPEEVPKRFLRSIYAGELAERPLIPKGSLPAAVTLYTAAKYAEEGPNARYQLWVDCSSSHWKKSDVRELMNPRVLSFRWPGGPYTNDHDEQDQAIKLSRTLHTTVLKCTEQLEVFSSDYGSDGSELAGDLVYWLSELLTARKARVGR